MSDLERIPPETIEKLTHSIFRKIPELSGGFDMIYLHRISLEKLSDEEFILLWMLPDIEIRISKKTTVYIQERRNLLGLNPGRHSSIRQEEKQSPRKPYRDEWDEAFGS